MPGEGLEARLLAFPPAVRGEYKAGFCSHVDDWGRLVYDPQYWPWMWDLHERGELDRYTFPADHVLPDGTEVKAGETRERDPMTSMLICLLIKRLAGIHTIVDDLPNGSVYLNPDRPNAPGNWTPTQPDWRTGAGLERWLDLIAFHQRLGFATDLVYCDTYAEVENGVYRGWLRAVKARGLADRSFHTHAWESSGKDQTWTTRQNWRAGEIAVEELGADAQIAVHMDSAPPGRCTVASFLGVAPVGEPAPESKTPPKVSHTFIEKDEASPHYGKTMNYWIEADDPSGGSEVDAMRACPFTVIKTQMPLDGAFNQHYRERQLECWDRYAPPGTWVPSLKRPVTGPDWFRGIRRILFVVFEPGVPYVRFRGLTDDAGVRDVQAYFDGIGVTNQGCLWADPNALADAA